MSIFDDDPDWWRVLARTLAMDEQAQMVTDLLAAKGALQKAAQSGLEVAPLLGWIDRLEDERRALERLYG